MISYNVELKNKTILITGAAGFIGSNLAKRLFKEVSNIKIIGIDRLKEKRKKRQHSTRAPVNCRFHKKIL